MEEKTVQITELVLDLGCQPRATLNNEAVDEYAELLAAEVKLPIIDVVLTEEGYVIVDGYHRTAAAMQVQQEFIRVNIVEEGDLGRARWLAAAANQGHGVRRTNADKRQALILALDSDVGEEQSLMTIAKHVGVSKSFVHKVKDERQSSTVDDEPDEEPAAESPQEGEERPEEDMYQTAGRTIQRCYRKICKVLGEEDDVCEALFVAMEKAKEREL